VTGWTVGENPGLRDRASVVLLLGMNTPKSNDPLHGVTLEKIVTRLAEEYGWEELGQRIPVRCFLYDPSVKSSLTFLRKTPWARKKVEDLYVQSLPPSS